VLGFGGQSGGGKSFLLLGLALTEHRQSVIFRREAMQGRSLLDESRLLLAGTGGRFNGQHSAWRDIPGGRSLEFGGVKEPSDVLTWRGRPHDFIGIDEADMLLESQVRFLLGWNRTSRPGQRCRAVLCFNPPATAEGRWLLSFFGPWVDRKHPRPAAPGELRWYAMVDGKEVERPDGAPFDHRGETITPRSRSFIPARVQDNPYLMATGYLAQLQSLPEPLRSQLLHGDFAAGVEDDPWQVIPTAWVEAAMARWRPTPPAGSKLSAVGVDVARGGKAQTVLARRYGSWWGQLEKHPGRTTPDGRAVAGLVSKALTENGSALVCLDSIGIGSSPADLLRMLRKGTRLLPILSGSTTTASDRAGVLRFTNVRAFLYWSLRELLDPANGHAVQLPPDRELLADLTAPRWEMTASGVKVEAKEKIVERLGRSVDAGDSVMYSIAQPA
jgi:hypothetical protein